MSSLRTALASAGLPMNLPELRITPDHMQIFMFSAATWNRHHIHYSKDAAQAEGLPDVVVQRALLGDFLARLLTSWVKDEAEIRAVSWKVVSSAVPGQTLRCQGEATACEVKDGREYVACDIRIVQEDGRLVTSGLAKLELL